MRQEQILPPTRNAPLARGVGAGNAAKLSPIADKPVYCTRSLPDSRSFTLRFGNSDQKRSRTTTRQAVSLTASEYQMATKKVAAKGERALLQARGIRERATTCVPRCNTWPLAASSLYSVVADYRPTKGISENRQGATSKERLLAQSSICVVPSQTQCLRLQPTAKHFKLVSGNLNLPTSTKFLVVDGQH